MIEDILLDSQDRMEKTLVSSQSELTKIRTGRANISILDSVRVDYYGSKVPVNQAANIGVPEARMIIIQPWERNMLAEIERAILKADIGITPNNDGNVIRLPIPPLTEERRKNLVKVVHNLAEDGRIAVRNIRRDAMDQLKKAQKDGKISEDEQFNAGIDVQATTDENIKKIDGMAVAKEKEVLEI
ncbi:ribosome recycling factor [bacterium]|nr:ribosome recycling factor [bacterium]